jgi:hypothetical protein
VGALGGPQRRAPLCCSRHPRRGAWLRSPRLRRFTTAALIRRRPGRSPPLATLPSFKHSMRDMSLKHKKPSHQGLKLLITNNKIAQFHLLIFK